MSTGCLVCRHGEEETLWLPSPWVCPTAALTLLGSLGRTMVSSGHEERAPENCCRPWKRIKRNAINSPPPGGKASRSICERFIAQPNDGVVMLQLIPKLMATTGCHWGEQDVDETYLAQCCLWKLPKSPTVQEGISFRISLTLTAYRDLPCLQFKSLGRLFRENNTRITFIKIYIYMVTNCIRHSYSACC